MGLNHVEIAQQLLEKGLGEYVAYNLDKFVGLNHVEIAQQLLEKGLGEYVAYNLDKFVGLNHVEIAQQFLEKGLGESVAYNLDKFVGLNIADIVNSKNKDKVENLLKQASIFCKARGNFNKLFKILEWAKKDIPPLNNYLAITEKEAQIELQNLMSDENYYAANNFIKCLELLGHTIETTVKKVASEKCTLEERARKDRQERDINKETKIVADELIKFYLFESINADIIQLRHNLEHHCVNKHDELPIAQELSRTKEMELAILEAEISVAVKSMHQWIKEYLVVAVNSELKHQKDKITDSKIYEDAILPTMPNRLGHPSIENFIELATPEEIRQYLYEAETRFRHYKWGDDYGGRSWADIALVGYEMWQENVPLKDKTVNLDHVFDLQHNTGMIFDKWPKLIKDKATDKKILDIKYKAKDFKELTDNLLAFTGISSNAVALIGGARNMIKKIESIKDSPKREKLGGD